MGVLLCSLRRSFTLITWFSEAELVAGYRVMYNNDNTD